MSSLSTSAVSALFFASGAASLIYQVVWMRMLIRVFGVTTLAVATIVSVFMGGLALGAWLGGRRSERGGNALGSYGALELIVALAGVLATWALLALPEFYASLGLPPSLRPLARFVLSALVLLPPTAAMGATLPILTRFLTERGRGAGFGLAVLYGWNTFGAFVGVLAAGFVLLPFFGELGTVSWGVVLNLSCALAARLFSRAEPSEATAPVTDGEDDSFKVPQGFLLALFFAGGFAALGLEVLWSRLMVLLVGSSVYAYSLLLGAILAGIGLGGLLCSLWLLRLPSRRECLAVFGALQIGAALSASFGIAAYKVMGLFASSKIYLFTSFERPLDMALFAFNSVLVVFLPSLMTGASFPLAGALLSRTAADSGRAAGRAFAANTWGGVLGSLAAGFILVPWVGTWIGAALLIGLFGACGLSALGAAGAALMLRRSAGAALGIAALLLVWAQDPARAILAKRLSRMNGEISFHREETAATVTGWAGPNEQRSLLLNGITVSGAGDYGKAMAYLPLILRGSMEKMLVICFGAGNTFRAGVLAGLQVDAVDLVPGVIASFPWYHPDAADIRARPGARTVVDDGRHFLLTSRDSYDAIIVDGSPPVWSARTVNLYTREFARLAKSRLKPEGVLSIWVPVPCLTTDVGVILRVLAESFEHLALWSHPGGPGFFLMASEAPLSASRAEIESAHRRYQVGADAPSFTVERIISGMPLSDGALRRIASAFPPLTDDRPYTEFPLGPMLTGDRVISDTAEIVSRLDFIGKNFADAGR